MKVGKLDKMVEEFNNGTYDLTCDGKCTGCGACCSNFLPMTNDEIKTIKRYITKNKIIEHSHTLPLAEPTIDMTCPFLNDSKSCDKCEIYEVRPKVCREFICNPKQRKQLSKDYTSRCRVLDVRKEFYC